MNKLMKIKYQYLLNNYLKKDSISQINDLIFSVGPEIYDCLTYKEESALIKLALKNQEHSLLLSHLLLYSKNINIKEILPHILINQINPDIFLKYLSDFMSLALNDDRKNLILHLARFIAANPNNYTKEINLIKNFLLNNEVNYITTSIAPLKGFYDNKLENKIINSESKYIYDYLIKAPYKLTFLKNYYLTKPSNENIKKIASKFTNKKNIVNKEIYDYLVEIITTTDIKDPELQSNHLFTLYKINKSYPKLDLIIYSLINLNIPQIIKELMNELNETKQNEICLNYLETPKTPFKYFVTLASTTNCNATYKLIDKVLLNNNLLINVDLIGHLEGRFLSYTLDKILKEHNTIYYLNIINKLYLLGYNNYLQAINFIFKYKLEHLFTPEKLTKLAFYQEENLKRARKM